MRKLISDIEGNDLTLRHYPTSKDDMKYSLSHDKREIYFTEKEARNLYEALKEIFEKEAK